MHFRRFALLLIAGSLLTGAVVAQQPSTSTLIPRVVNLPVVNLASSETAEVNVVNLISSVMSVTTGGSSPTEGTTVSCTGAIAFFGATGLIIGSSTPFTIGSGEIFSASLPYSAISPNNVLKPNGGRTPIRAVVTITETVGNSAVCSLVSNLETYDTSSGVTNIHVDASPMAFPGLIIAPFNR
jgi:hypothetical protein